MTTTMLPNWHTTSNQLWFNVGITSIGLKEKIDELQCHFDVPFRWNFDWPKMDVIIYILCLRNFDGAKINIVSTYFFDIISMDDDWASFPCIFFNLILIDKKLTLLWCIFYAILIENCSNFDVLVLMCFWKKSNRGRFDIPFWQVFDISKTKAAWRSLLDVILF